MPGPLKCSPGVVSGFSGEAEFGYVCDTSSFSAFQNFMMDGGNRETLELAQVNLRTPTPPHPLPDQAEQRLEGSLEMAL